MNLNNLCGGLTILALLAGPTVAQQTPVYQDGKAVPGGAVKSVANGRINSAGGISSNANGQGFNLYNITDDQAPGLCINSAPPKAKYNALCIGHDKASDAVISLDSYGGMAAKELKLRLNGTAYTRPGSVAIVGSNAVAINNAALKVLQGAAGKRITRMGYYTPGDGGSVAYNWSDSNCAAADDGAQVQPTGITGCWIADFPGDNLDIRQFGADMTGAADSALAISRAFAASLGKSGSCVFVPAGVVRLASVVAVGAIPNPGQFCLRGNGHQSSILNWTSATGGITMTTAGQGTSFIIKGLSFTTTQAGGGAAVSITSTGAWGGGDANYNLFDDLWIGGDDKLILHDTNLHYWTEAIVTTGVSNVNMQNVGINGGGLRNGDGFRFEGGATCCALLLNVINSSFDNLVKGLIIGNLTQGYEVANTQFQNGDYGIYCPASSTQTNQIAVVNSQFNTRLGNVHLECGIVNVLLSNNLMFVDSNSSSVYLAASLSTTITGNRFEGMASTVNQTGIEVVASYPNDTGAVIGNNFYNLKTGVTFGANTGRWVVNSNAYFGNVATQVSNGATVPVDNKIGNCTTISGSSLPTTIQPAQPINSIQFWGKIGYGAANSSQAGLNVAQPGRLRFLNVAVNPAPGGTITDRAYVYLGGATTALTCTITGTNKVCLDNSHEVAISPGAPDGGYIQYTTGNGGSARNISWSLEYCTGA